MWKEPILTTRHWNVSSFCQMTSRALAYFACSKAIITFSWPSWSAVCKDFSRRRVYTVGISVGLASITWQQPMELSQRTPCYSLMLKPLHVGITWRWPLPDVKRFSSMGCRRNIHPKSIDLAYAPVSGLVAIPSCTPMWNGLGLALATRCSATLWQLLLFGVTFW